MMIMIKVKEFIYKNWRGLGILVLATLLILWNVHQYKAVWVAEKKASVAIQNEAVMRDSVRIVTDKTGKLESDKLAYLTNSINNLSKLNTDLAQEVKNIKGNVTTIIQGQIKLVDKPVPFVVRGELIDSTVISRFNYDTTYSLGNFRKLSGFTSYDLKTGKASGQKEQDEIGIKFVTGIKNLDKGKPEIFLKSDYPGFQVSSLEGAVLDPKLFEPKNKTPLITPSLTVGWTPIAWDNVNQAVHVSTKNVGVTMGLGFNIFKILGVKK